MKRIAVAFVVLLLMAAFQVWAATEVVVIGTNTYPADVNTVQNAVDNFDIVTLSGTFNFGQAVWGVDDNGTPTGTTAGMLVFSRPNVLLKADEITGAKIIGGGAPSFLDPWTWPVIYIIAPGVTVRGLVMQDSVDTGVFITSAFGAQTTGNTIILEKNTITAPWAPVYSLYRGGWPLIVRENKLSGTGGIWDVWTVLTFNQDGEPIRATSRLDILDNTITADGSGEGNPYADGIAVYGWPVPPPEWIPDVPPDADPADWGDNAPVTITGNTISIDNEWWDGICPGRSNAGLNHSLVANNTIRGKGCAGIEKYGYGHDNRIMGNDLSELVAGGPACSQIAVMAPDTTVANNILGNVGPGGVAMFIWSANHHPYPDPLNTPMPLPLERSIIMDNDYRHSNCPGWSQGLGCILVASETDLQGWTGAGTEVRYNIIKETGKFPRGTGGPKDQIFELKVGPSPLVHDNRIVGLPAQNIPNPGIGQIIIRARQRMLRRTMPFDLKMLRKPLVH
jgi:hypothetical protein